MPGMTSLRDTATRGEELAALPPEDRLRLASDPATPLPLLVELALDGGDPDVRAAVLRNSGLSEAERHSILITE